MTDEIARRAQLMVDKFGLDHAITVATTMVMDDRQARQIVLGTVNEPLAADVLHQDEALLVDLLQRRHMPEYAGAAS